MLELLPSSQFEIFLDLIGALGFGLAAVWLLSSYLGWKHRMLAFLGILLAQGGFSVLAFAVRQGWEGVRARDAASGDFPGGERLGHLGGAEPGRAGVPGAVWLAAAELVADRGAGGRLAAGDRTVLHHHR